MRRYSRLGGCPDARCVGRRREPRGSSRRRRERRCGLCRLDGLIWTCAWRRKGLRESCWRRSGWTRDRRLRLLHLLPLLRKLEWKSASHGDDPRRFREMQPWARGRGRSRHRRRRARGPGRRGGCCRRKAFCWWEMLLCWRARGCAERAVMLRGAGAGRRRVLSAATTAWRWVWPGARRRRIVGQHSRGWCLEGVHMLRAKVRNRKHADGAELVVREVGM